MVALYAGEEVLAALAETSSHTHIKEQLLAYHRPISNVAI